MGRGKLLGNDLSPIISGRFDVVKGTLLAKDNEFTINFARIEMPQDPGFDPVNVNVQASTLKNYQSIDYRIFMSAEGDPDDLRLNFRSEPSLAQNELIALLTLGYVPQEQPVGSQGSTIAQSASAEAFQLLFGQALGKGIQKQTGFDVRVGTSANLKQEDTIPKVSVYRKLGDRVSATFGRSLDVSRPENNFKIDYRLLKNLNLTGVWENPEENRHSLGLDLRLEFEIK
jgi:autotransporter translocation and assembly factor TamB